MGAGRPVGMSDFIIMIITGEDILDIMIDTGTAQDILKESL